MGTLLCVCCVEAGSCPEKETGRRNCRIGIQAGVRTVFVLENGAKENAPVRKRGSGDSAESAYSGGTAGDVIR